ncbi:MAG: hypothetical protein LBC79_07845 [Deltaproteobacteria bacterium]|jgi:hypothetical protein|nr:hypothetical protein [Deltaproteobacteria bacterium]
MITPENEAKEKACCKATANLEDGRLVTPACLASGCMAWRWADKPTKYVLDVPANETPDGEPIMHIAQNTERRGFCGLAGRPE